MYPSTIRLQETPALISIRLAPPSSHSNGLLTPRQMLNCCSGNYGVGVGYKQLDTRCSKYLSIPLHGHKVGNPFLVRIFFKGSTFPVVPPS